MHIIQKEISLLPYVILRILYTIKRKCKSRAL